MGTLVEALAPSYGFTIARVLRSADNLDASGITLESCRSLDIAIDFTTSDAVVANALALAAAGVNAVIGTTGWRNREALVRRAVASSGTGVVVAANFSLGANLLESAAAHVAGLLRGQSDFGAWLHEQHHAAKKDAPSGTALTIVDAVTRADPSRVVDVTSTRAGHMPGTHTLAFDGLSEQVSLTHLVRDRAAFAHGALLAARWVAGRRGWFSMRDVLGLTASHDAASG
jgi:4-hydroxy-tetrahydrodipicolinate reductase